MNYFKYSLLLLALSGVSKTYAQADSLYVNGSYLGTLPGTFLEVWYPVQALYINSFTNVPRNLTMNVHYGQGEYRDSTFKLSNKNRQFIRVESHIQALDRIEKHGWCLVGVWNKADNYPVYLFRRKE